LPKKKNKNMGVNHWRNAKYLDEVQCSRVCCTFMCIYYFFLGVIHVIHTLEWTTPRQSNSGNSLTLCLGPGKFFWQDLPFLGSPGNQSICPYACKHPNYFPTLLLCWNINIHH
jgi:hypothetical protein